jgi:UDP-4-amino-4,6-dideoxy-N-acetyl-beta-L-altrosamine N-acetyltransferase
MEVTLRPLAEIDGPTVVAWRRRPDVHEQLFVQEPPTLESHRKWYLEYQVSKDRREYVILADGRPVGTIGLSRIDGQNARAEYGILIGDPNARGRGIARAASLRLLAEAFGALGLARVYLHVFPENHVALRLYEGLGFRREGVLREHAVKDGRRRDVLVMGILARDIRELGGR